MLSEGNLRSRSTAEFGKVLLNESSDAGWQRGPGKPGDAALAEIVDVAGVIGGQGMLQFDTPVPRVLFHEQHVLCGAGALGLVRPAYGECVLVHSLFAELTRAGI